MYPLTLYDAALSEHTRAVATRERELLAALRRRERAVPAPRPQRARNRRTSRPATAAQRPAALARPAR